MRRSILLAATAAVIALPVALAGNSPSHPFSDPAHGYSMQVPDGWSEPAAGSVMSPDGAVRCTLAGQPNPQTDGKSQDEVNEMLKATYTPAVWQHQYFTGGVTGAIQESGITQIDIFDAPWARGMITYPGSATAKFGVIMYQSPGKIVSVNCIGDPTAYDNNFKGILIILNNARPL